MPRVHGAVYPVWPEVQSTGLRVQPRHLSRVRRLAFQKGGRQMPHVPRGPHRGVPRRAPARSTATTQRGPGGQERGRRPGYVYHLLRNASQPRHHGRGGAGRVHSRPPAHIARAPLPHARGGRRRTRDQARPSAEEGPRPVLQPLAQPLPARDPAVRAVLHSLTEAASFPLDSFHRLASRVRAARRSSRVYDQASARGANAGRSV